MKATNLIATIVLATLATACAYDAGTKTEKHEKNTGENVEPKVTEGDDETRSQLEKMAAESDGALPSEKLKPGVGPAYDQDSVNLLASQHPGWGQYCFISLHHGLPLNAPVACRGTTLPNWFVDNDGGAHYASARCSQRAAEWYAYCGIPRPTYAGTYLVNGAGQWIAGLSPGGAQLGGVYAPKGWTYFIPN